MDSTLNIYGFLTKKMYYTKVDCIAVKLSNNCKVYKVTATYWKRGSSQEDGDDVSMTYGYS